MLENLKMEYILVQALQFIYDIADKAAPRCKAVQQIPAFNKETSKREPDAANIS